MTKVITRFFDSAKQARSVRRYLVSFEGFAPSILRLYESKDGLVDALTAQGVADQTAQTYADQMNGDGAVLLVFAGYKPLAVAKTTRTVTADMGAVAIPGLVEEVEIADPPTKRTSVLTGHPRWLTRLRDGASTTYHMANWPIPLISRRKPWTESFVPKHGRMASWPFDLIDRRVPFSESIFPRHARMANFPIGLLVPGHKFMAKFPFAHIVPGHKHMAKFPFAHIVPGHKYMAKFPFGHIVPQKWRHMANWPFPHLINGKRGANALVPGHKYMANFPFGHIVPGHKHQAGVPIGHIVPGHRFMAKFPFAHIVPGHKYMAKFPFAHIIPGHKHQADMILPLTIKRDGPGGFSFSRMIGLSR